MTKKKAIVSSLFLILVGVGIGRYLLPNNVVTDEAKSERTDKEVVKTVHEVTRPDGTKEKYTETKETTKKQLDSDKRVEITVSKPNYMASVMVGKNIHLETTYAIKVDRRVLGNIFAGAYVSTNKDIGVSVGYEF